MKNETSIKREVSGSSAPVTVGLHAIVLFEHCDWAELPGGAEEFCMNMHRRESAMTPTLEHILHDAHTSHEFPIRNPRD